MSPWLTNLYRIGPLILSAWNVTTELAPIIVAAIAAAEKLKTYTGAEKKRTALEQFDAGIVAYNSVAGPHVVDAALAHQVASIAIDAVVATVNLWTKTAIGS